MRVILQQDVKNLGKIGDLVNVAPGYARNFLVPRQLAIEATERRINEFEHLQRIAEKKKKAALASRQEVLNKLKGVTVKVQKATGEGEKLFGSVTNHDISLQLEKQGFSVDRRDIILEEPIRVLGSHRVVIKMGEGLETEIAVVVERLANA